MTARQTDASKASAEAKRFIETVGAWFHVNSNPNHAAMLRASMDLTRALAQLRKGK